MPPEATCTDGDTLVLLVEDDPDVSDAISIALEVFDIPVHRAANGRLALERLQQGLRPSVILLDLMMPVMDGHEFRQAQRSDPALADIPVVVLSAQSVPDDVADQLGATGWLKKPVDIADLLHAVRPPSLPR